MTSTLTEIIKVLEAVLIYIKATNAQKYQNEGTHDDALIEEIEDALHKLKRDI